jgi:hypothetical protein
MNLKDLAKPFPAKDIDWRISRAGEKDGKPWAFVLAYIDARAVMDRLDEVVGPEKWRDRYWKEGNTNFCGLSIKIGDEWVEKIDGSEDTEFEAVKGGISGAFKRAAVKWGIGRYLYNLTESFAKVVEKGTPAARYQGAPKDKSYSQFYWLPPDLPPWALPQSFNNSPKVDVTNATVTFESQVELGDYVVRLGKKHVGKRLSEIDIYELASFSEWLSNSKKRDALGDETLNAIEAFLKSREVTTR